MKKIFKISTVVLLFTIILFSCKDESKTPEVKIPNNFIFTVNLLMKKNDTLHLYYTEDNTINFKEENSMWVSSLGSEEVQKVRFELPKGVFPTQFRIDLGVNTENEKIIFKGFNMEYKGKSKEYIEPTVYNYFRIDDNTTIIDSITKELSRKDPKIKAGASLYPHETILKPEIDNLVK